MPDDDPAIHDPDDLYALDPAEFTAARAALVKRLKAEGRKDEAAAVGRLRRPNALAHALNQVARDDPEVVEAALEAGARLRAATDAALGGDAGSLRAATADEREASAAVVRAAGKLPGTDAATATARISSTIRAAILDDEVADRLRRGVLTSDLDSSGFGGGMGGFGATDGPTPSGTTGATAIRPSTRTKPEAAGTGAAPKRPRASTRDDPQEPPVDLAERRRAKAAAAAAERAEEEAAAEAARQERRRRQELEADVRRLEKRADRLVAAAERAEEEAAEARDAATHATEEAAEARAALDEDD